MDFVAGVLFADSEGGSGTDVTLRVGYYLPGALPSNAALQLCMQVSEISVVH